MTYSFLRLNKTSPQRWTFLSSLTQSCFCRCMLVLPCKGRRLIKMWVAHEQPSADLKTLYKIGLNASVATSWLAGGLAGAQHTVVIEWPSVEQCVGSLRDGEGQSGKGEEGRTEKMHLEHICITQPCGHVHIRFCVRDTPRAPLHRLCEWCPVELYSHVALRSRSR